MTVREARKGAKFAFFGFLLLSAICYLVAVRTSEALFYILSSLFALGGLVFPIAIILPAIPPKRRR